MKPPKLKEGSTVDIEDEQVLDVLRLQMSGVLQVQRKKEFIVHRTLENGDVQKVTIDVLDAGPNVRDPQRRFKCTARADDGRIAAGNSAQTMEAALDLVHLVGPRLS